MGMMPYRLKHTQTGSSGSRWYSIMRGKRIVTEFWEHGRALYLVDVLNRELTRWKGKKR